MTKYHVYTDGSSRGNPGPGGWGAVILNEEENKIIHYKRGTQHSATNNQMELTALLYALQCAEASPADRYIIHSDSAYAVNAFNDWIRGWAVNGWKNSKGQTVENLGLMQALHSYCCREFPNYSVVKCHGHAGDLGNELADALATGTMKKFEDLCEFWEIKAEGGEE